MSMAEAGMTDVESRAERARAKANLRYHQLVAHVTAASRPTPSSPRLPTASWEL